MPSFCVVNNCCDKYGHAENISFHKFPFKRQDLLQKWIEFAQRGTTWKPNKWSAICSQHFTPEDFNCANARKTLKKTAIPSVRVDHGEQVACASNSVKHRKRTSAVVGKQAAEDVRAEYWDYDYEEREMIPSPPGKISSATKMCCRLCGTYACSAGTFSTNFEIFGMVQKCFPTLNIQQHDNLPKDMCPTCLKSLRSFSEFVDKVILTQRDMQQKYRSEKQAKPAEQRPLKIKQEPVAIKVKQEDADGFDSFLSDDLDIPMDDCCEPEADAADSVDQKLVFSDFPLINAQDIINNCDIMEIINLDDPFINIPDDDAATTSATELAGKTYAPSAHQLLQAHMMIDEHNYASPAEDFKEEWQIKKCCKTEEAEAERHDAVEAACEDYYHTYDDYQNTYACGRQAVFTDILTVSERSSKPIVTSVSAIAESRLHLSNDSGTSEGNKVIVTAISDPQPATGSAASHRSESGTNTKPNIVVLNESIVKSAEAFQLHACVVCQLKFFSIESLQQHARLTHDAVVTGASNNHEPIRTLAFNTDAETMANNENTTEAGICVQGNTDQRNANESEEPKPNTFSEQLKNLQSWQLNMKTLQLNAPITTWTHASTTKVYSVNEATHQEYEESPTNTSSANALNVVEEATDKKNEVPIPTKVVPQHTNVKLLSKITGENQCTNLPRGRNNTTSLHAKISASNGASRTRQNFAFSVSRQQCTAADFKFLQRRYRILLRKCKALEENHQLHARNKSGRNRHTCPRCRSIFSNIYQLLHHKQKHHRPSRLRRSFLASCLGCEKYFLSKLALTNHMKYICQSMSLRWFKTQLQTFKCRACRSISFTHWRLYRNHEIVCKRRIEQRRRYRKPLLCPICSRSHSQVRALTLHMMRHGAAWQLQCERCGRSFRQVAAVLQHHSKECKLNSAKSSKLAVSCYNCQQSFRSISKILAHYHCSQISRISSSSGGVKGERRISAPFACNTCTKTFTTMNGLCQHRITHVQEKRHKCGLCERVFKRRGGLTQHMKGFHLQLKPYECSVCSYRYALKCDMQRCKHSTLQKRHVESAASGLNPHPHPFPASGENLNCSS